MATSNPNTCPHCNSSNSGANFGFNPQRINNDETLIHDVLFSCADCGGEWAAIGYVMIAQRNGGELSKEAHEALVGAVAGAEELRVELLEPGGNRVELRRAVHEWNGTATSRMTVDSPERANYQRPLYVSGTRD